MEMQKPKPTWVAVMAGFENQVDMLCIYVAPEDMYETCKACVDAVKEVWEGYDPINAASLAKEFREDIAYTYVQDFALDSRELRVERGESIEDYDELKAQLTESNRLIYTIRVFPDGTGRVYYNGRAVTCVCKQEEVTWLKGVVDDTPRKCSWKTAEQFICDCEERGYVVMQVDEGCLGIGKWYLDSCNPDLYSFIITERYLNCWSSDQVIQPVDSITKEQYDEYCAYEDSLLDD